MLGYVTAWEGMRLVSGGQKQGGCSAQLHRVPHEQWLPEHLQCQVETHLTETQYGFNADEAVLGVRSG